MGEIYTRRIKALAGDGTGSIKITPTPGKRLHGVGVSLAWNTTNVSTAGDSLIEQLAAVTEIRVLVGFTVRRRLSATQLRDYMLLNGATYDFDYAVVSPNNVSQLYIPFAEDWFLANVADSLAWNPAILGGDITIEIDSSASLTCVAYERVSDDLNAPSAGIITLETIMPVAGGTAFYVEREVEARGRFVLASIYPDSTNSNEITPVSLLLGRDDVMAHEALTSAQSDEALERFGFTPAASGRTANIYDLVFVKGDALSRAPDFGAWGRARFKVEAASSMGGTCTAILVRNQAK